MDELVWRDRVHTDGRSFAAIISEWGQQSKYFRWLNEHDHRNRMRWICSVVTRRAVGVEWGSIHRISGLSEVLCSVSTRPVASSCTLGGTRFIMRQWHDILTLAESSLALLYRDETETEVQVELRHFDVQVAQRTWNLGEHYTNALPYRIRPRRIAENFAAETWCIRELFVAPSNTNEQHKWNKWYKVAVVAPISNPI